MTTYDISELVMGRARDLNRGLEATRKDIDAAGGTAEFTGLYAGDRRVAARVINTKFGAAWLLDDSEAELIAKRGKKFLPTGANSRVLRDLGLAERAERAPAGAVLDGEGRGWEGLMTVRVKVYRSGDKWGADAKLEEV
jgi:hypothetical protein